MVSVIAAKWFFFQQDTGNPEGAGIATRARAPVFWGPRRDPNRMHAIRMRRFARQPADLTLATRSSTPSTAGKIVDIVCWLRVLTRLGPAPLAMMTVCARWDLTVTRAWTFMPAKAEEVDMRAAIFMVCGGVNEGFTWVRIWIATGISPAKYARIHRQEPRPCETHIELGRCSIVIGGDGLSKSESIYGTR